MHTRIHRLPVKQFDLLDYNSMHLLVIKAGGGYKVTRAGGGYKVMSLTCIISKGHGEQKA